jgi:hypothetical protein
VHQLVHRRLVVATLRNLAAVDAALQARQLADAVGSAEVELAGRAGRREDGRRVGMGDDEQILELASEGARD